MRSIQRPVRWGGQALFTGLLLCCTLARAQSPATRPTPLPATRQSPATQPAPLDADQQRRLLLQKAGANGRGPHPERARQLEATLTTPQVAAAMQRGVSFLLPQLTRPFSHSPLAENLFPGEQRRWLPFAGDQQVGLLSLDLYALLESQRLTRDPRLRPGSRELQPVIRWLVNARTGKTYSAALQAAALAALPQNPEVRTALQRVRNDLARGIHPFDGAYGYNLTSQTSPLPPWDNSNTQFALLGMWAADQAGLRVSHHYWQAQSRHWRMAQALSGEWAYHLPARLRQEPDSNTMTTPALTAAGVASLYVTLDKLASDASPPGDDTAISRGMAAIRHDFSANSKYLGDDLYYAFALQRVAVASGAKYIDGINWYRRAAAELIVSQRPNGSWQYANSPMAGTGFALLILAHGGSPVLMNKLIYGRSENTWNIHPRDDANITRYLARQMEQPLNWQTVSLAANPDDWLDAPVLLITGKGEPRFTPADLLKLQHYIHSGGMIFSISIDGDQTFTDAIKRYASQITAGQYPMRKLPANHPLFTLQEKVAGLPEVWGLSNGLRELWIHSPDDLAATWQHAIYALKNDWAFAANLYVYATGKAPPPSRLNTLALPVEHPTTAPTTAPAQPLIHIARLLYDGNCNPEPGAWPRLIALLHHDLPANSPAARLLIDPTPIQNLDPARTPIALLTGTDTFTLDDNSRAALKHFLHHGGTLIADAAGSSDAFKTAFLHLLPQLDLPASPEVLPPNHPLFTSTLSHAAALDPDHTTYRPATPPALRKPGRPELWTWQLHHRDAILFSPLDITSGLLGTHTWGIPGYSPETAQSLARNLLLYALQQRAPP